MTITKILKPELFTADNLALAIYAAAPDYDDNRQTIAWLDKPPEDRAAMIALTGRTLAILSDLGIIQGPVIAKPYWFTAARWAQSYFVALDEQLFRDRDEAARALAWNTQPEAVRAAEIDLMQLTLDSLEQMGVLG